MAGDLHAAARRARPGERRGALHRPARDRGVLRPRQARPPRPEASPTTTATPPSAWPRPPRATSSAFGSDGPPGCYDDFEDADLVVLFGANVADNHPLIAPRFMGPDRPRPDRGRPARHQDGDDRRPAPAGAPPHGHHAHQRDPPHPVRGGARRPGVPGRAHRRRADELEAHVAAYDPERVAAECGIPIDDLRHGRPRHRHRRALPHRVDDGRSTTRCRAPRRVALLCTPGRRHRQHRSPWRRPVLHHRAVQRDGHPGGGLHGLDAGLPGLRRPRRPRRARRAVGHVTRATCPPNAVAPTRTSSTRS